MRIAATFVRTGFIAASSYSSSLLNRNNNIFNNIINNNNNNNRIGNNIGSSSSSSSKRTRTGCGIMMSSSSLSGSNNDNDDITTTRSTATTATPDNTKIMNNNNNDCSRCGIDYPELVVFDLDACFWDQEMYEMSTIPTKKDIVMGSLSVDNENKQNDEDDEGVIGVYSGRNKISLHKGSLLALQEHYIDHKYPGMKICFASSADTPFAEKVGRASLQLLEIAPGVPIWKKLMKADWNNVDVNQIGRQPPLSSNKAKSHFPRIREMTGIKYDKMLFFDDCNWGDHCGMVAKACKESGTNKGVVTHRTPYGLKESDWRKGLELYKKSSSSLSSQA